MSPEGVQSTSADDAVAITNELYRYAELIDAGRFDDVGRLMEHCTFVYGEQRDPGPAGAAAIAESYRSAVVVYPDGTPRTRHVTTNPDHRDRRPTSAGCARPTPFFSRRQTRRCSP